MDDYAVSPASDFRKLADGSSTTNSDLACGDFSKLFGVLCVKRAFNWASVGSLP
jgi:hypothetical protein